MNATTKGSLITAGGDILSTGLSTFMQWYGMKAQTAENRRVEGIRTGERNADIARSEKWQKKGFAFQEKQFLSSQNQQKFNNMMNVTNNMWAKLSTKPQMQRNLAQMWKTRSV